MGKGHDSITNKLKLGLKLGVFLGQALFTGAHHLVTLVVRGCQPAGVAAFEVVLPKF